MSKKSKMRRILEDIRKTKAIDSMSREQMRDLLIAITKKLGCRLVVRTVDVKFEKVVDFSRSLDSQKQRFDEVIEGSCRKIWTVDILLPQDVVFGTLPVIDNIWYCAGVSKIGDMSYNFTNCEGTGLSEEEAYSELIALFVMPNGGHVSVGHGKIVRFPPCSSVSQLRMNMAIEEGA